MSDYQHPPSSYAPTQNSTLAIISLISGILSFFLVPLLGAIVAIITGHLAKKEIRESAGRLTGSEMATIGLVLGYINLVLMGLSICCILLMVLGVIGVPALCLPFTNSFNY